DAWGNRRNASGTDYPTGCLTFHPGSLTLRGFTGQEEMDNLCLVNLNADSLGSELYLPAIRVIQLAWRSGWRLRIGAAQTIFPQGPAAAAHPEGQQPAGDLFRAR
ncbi:MAG TPA: hypothetical protein VGL97_10865, partial [Bryobacteraceae bacterium]